MPFDKLLKFNYARWSHEKQEALVVFSPINPKNRDDIFNSIPHGETAQAFQIFFTPDLKNPNLYQDFIKPFAFWWPVDNRRYGHNSWFYKGQDPRNVKIEQGLFKDGGNSHEIEAFYFMANFLYMQPDFHKHIVRALMHPTLSDKAENIRQAAQRVMRLHEVALELHKHPLPADDNR